MHRKALTGIFKALAYIAKIQHSDQTNKDISNMTYKKHIYQLDPTSFRSSIISSSRDLSLGRRHIAVIVYFVGCSNPG